MIKDIITDKLLLSMPSDPVGDDEDIQHIIDDLMDTAVHWAGTPTGCLGLAANQIGWLRRAILVWTGVDFELMINPVWEPRAGKMGCSHEQCLSRPSVRVKVKRHKRIKCHWLNVDRDSQLKSFSQLTARIIQHEVDHLDGIFINNQ